MENPPDRRPPAAQLSEDEHWGWPVQSQPGVGQADARQEGESGNAEPRDQLAVMAKEIVLPVEQICSAHTSPPPARPGLIALGGEKAFSEYQKRFHDLYPGGKMIDVRGRCVIFPGTACRHVCFEGEDKVSYRRSKRSVWSQARAERIGWIRHALENPDEIRPDRGHPGNEAYLVIVPEDRALGFKEERYGVFVDASEEALTFLTAFPMERAYWNEMRRGGKCIFRA